MNFVANVSQWSSIAWGTSNFVVLHAWWTACCIANGRFTWFTLFIALGLSNNEIVFCPPSLVNLAQLPSLRAESS